MEGTEITGSTDTTESATQEAQAASEGHAEPSSAPSASSESAWTPPSKDAWEAFQRDHSEAKKYADIGRQYAPYKNQIDQLIQRGFTPAEAKAEVKAQQEEAEPEYRKHFSDENSRAETWKRFGSDPAFFEKTLQSIARAGMKGDLGEVAALKKELADMKRSHDEVRGWAIRANSAFAPNQEFAKYEQPALALVQAGRIADLPTAIEFVKTQERLKDLEAKAARYAAAPTVGKPSPRQDASAPKAGVRAGVSAPQGAPARGRGSALRNEMLAIADRVRGK